MTSNRRGLFLATGLLLVLSLVLPLVHTNAGARADGPAPHRLTLTRPDDQGVDQVWRYDIDSGDLLQLTHGPARSFGASWSPDDTTVVFLREGPGGVSVWLMGSDGADERQIHAERPGRTMTGWSPDGRTIAVEGQGKTELVRPDGTSAGSAGYTRAVWSNNSMLMLSKTGGAVHILTAERYIPVGRGAWSGFSADGELKGFSESTYSAFLDEGRDGCTLGRVCLGRFVLRQHRLGDLDSRYPGWAFSTSLGEDATMAMSRDDRCFSLSASDATELFCDGAEDPTATLAGDQVAFSHAGWSPPDTDGLIDVVAVNTRSLEWRHNAVPLVPGQRYRLHAFGEWIHDNGDEVPVLWWDGPGEAEGDPECTSTARDDPAAVRDRYTFLYGIDVVELWVSGSPMEWLPATPLHERADLDAGYGRGNLGCDPEHRYYADYRATSDTIGLYVTDFSFDHNKGYLWVEIWER